MTIFRSLFVATRLWFILIVLVLLFIAAYAFPILFPLIRVTFVLFICLIGLDAWLLFRNQVRSGVFARREVPDRLSNGDENPITIYLENQYAFRTNVEVIDEIPFQFQRRDVLFKAHLNPRETRVIRYELRPTRRGEYSFGAVNIFALSPLGLLNGAFSLSRAKQ